MYFSPVSQSALSTISASVLLSPKPRKLANTFCSSCLFASMSSTVSSLRLSSLPEGSPTRVVPPPTSTTGLPPVFCSQRNSMIGSSEPTWSERAVQSKPI